MARLKVLLSSGLVYFAAASLVDSNFAPLAWGSTAWCVWLLFILAKGWENLQRSDKCHLAWGWTSASAFMVFVSIYDPSFKAWGDVYYYCGEQMQYCTCDLRWNLAGWGKAFVLWNFLLSAALAVQKLVIHAGLRGLLPGEEVVTKESFISICWRLIPYWLNNWEQQWGAECSSMMFELPHFAVELLVVLPCVQILCSRLRILTLPAGQMLWPDAMHGRQAGVGDNRRPPALAPNVIQGVWRHMPEQHRLFPRLRANLRVLVMVLSVTALAAFNAVRMPLALEAQIHAHPRSPTLLEAALACEDSVGCWLSFDLGPTSNAVRAAYAAACPSLEPLASGWHKHGREMLKMRGEAHSELIPLVESALAVMRLSCERFFVLVSMFAAYLAFHARVPDSFRYLVRLNHRLSRLFQQVILNTFPAICWLYGAGLVFSTFVSLVFWGATARRLLEHLRKLASVVEPQGLQDASADQIERMNGSCAICWSEMLPASRAARGLAGRALPCGHAFHGPCIQRWLKQCHGQGRQPTCPLCNRAISLQVSYRLPLRRRAAPQPAAEEAAPLLVRAEQHQAAQEGAQQQQDGPQAPRAGSSSETAATSSASSSSSEGGESVRQPAVRRRVLRWGGPGEGGAAQPPLAASGGQLTQRSAPPWPQGPSLPVCLAPGADSRRDRGRARHRAGQRGSASSGMTHPLQQFLPAAEPPSSFNFQPARPPQPTAFLPPRSPGGAGSSSKQSEPGGPASNDGRGADAQHELSAAVQRDRQRAQAYLEFCRAQEVQMQATIQRCTGVMSEAWQTAQELMRNADQLEDMLHRRPGGESNIQELWRRQQQLWARSQELHKEGAAFLQP